MILEREGEGAAAAQETVIEAGGGWRHIDLAELWRYRELLYFIAWRDVKVRYKQTALGVLWAVLQPALAMLLFSVVFGRYAQVPSDGVPYPVFVLAGLLPWNYFAAVLNRSGASVVGGANLVTKVYFPRLILPVGAAAAAAVDLAVASGLLALLAAWYGVRPGPGLLLLPVLLAVTVLNAVGVGLWLSALTVRYRDIQHALPFLVQTWMFATPVIYPSSLLGAGSRWLLLNPMAGVIEAGRAAAFGHAPVPWTALAASAALGSAAFVSGALYFRRAERRFADII